MASSHRLELDPPTRDLPKGLMGSFVEPMSRPVPLPDCQPGSMDTSRLVPWTPYFGAQPLKTNAF